MEISKTGAGHFVWGEDKEEVCGRRRIVNW